MKCVSRYTLYIIAMVIVLASCEDTPFDASDQASSPNSASEYWYTRTLTDSQQQLLRRSYALGFSYDAVNGEKCDMNAVRCNVLNLDNLLADGILDVYEPHSTTTRVAVSHSFSEYCSVTGLTGEVSASIVLYSTTYKNISTLYELGLDTTICFHKEQYTDVRQEKIREQELSEVVASPDRYLSQSFLYGVNKVKNADLDDVIVVDSFINIFGTHVVTSATIGAKATLELQTSKQIINDYKSEESITTKDINYILTKKRETLSQTEQELIHQVLNNSTITLNVKGGDVSVFNGLVGDNGITDEDAAGEAYEKWTATLDQIDLTSKTSASTAELTDMEVVPIWELIPDAQVAKRVRTRIEASAPTMQEIYGNRNWVNTKFRYNPDQVTTYFNPASNKQSVTIDKPWVTNIVAAHRNVAAVCREWVPEISKTETVVVAYPIYENKIDMSLGLCQYGDSVYHVAWRYDRFVVTSDPTMTPSADGSLYLTCGTLSTSPSAASALAEYMDGYNMIAYEWPGSISVVDGSVKGDGWLTTRKFLGNFYLENVNQYTDIPNWTYKTDATPNEYYGSLVSSQAYSLSGLDDHSVNNRMVRNDDYTYYLNPKEAWYE